MLVQALCNMPVYTTVTYKTLFSPKFISFFFQHENIYCNYLCASNGYPQFMFLWSKKRNIYLDNPVLPWIGNIVKKSTYRIQPNYRKYPYKCTVKQFLSLQITASVLFVFFIKAYVLGTHLNCINFLMQFKWVPTKHASMKKIRIKCINTIR